MTSTGYKQLVGKKVRIRSYVNPTGLAIGQVALLTHYMGNAMFKGTLEGDPYGPSYSGIYYSDFDIIDNITGETEQKGFIKKKLLSTKKDKYGIEAVLELKDDEESIYVSSGVQALLELDEKSYIGVAIDYDSNNVYIFKETEEESGLKIENSMIKSFNIYRDLINHIFSKQMSVEPNRIKNPDYPDNTFFKVSKYNSQFKSQFEKLFISEIKNSEETSISEIQQVSSIFKDTDETEMPKEKKSIKTRKSGSAVDKFYHHPEEGYKSFSEKIKATNPVAEEIIPLKKNPVSDSDMAIGNSSLKWIDFVVKEQTTWDKNAQVAVEQEGIKNSNPETKMSEF